jgi:hypothetical protein
MTAAELTPGVRAFWPYDGRPMDDAELWTAFSTHAISHASWNHEMHLRTAFLFADRFDFDEAHLRLRAGIIRMNERHGLVETGARAATTNHPQAEPPGTRSGAGTVRGLASEPR